MKLRWASDRMRRAPVRQTHCFAWHEALTFVPPATLLRWRRVAFRLLWRRRSFPARPRLPGDIQHLIAAEPLLKLGLRVSPRTVRRELACGTGGGGREAANQRWVIFVRNHACAMRVCDFCLVVTAPFRVLFVVVGFPEPPAGLPAPALTGHRLPDGSWVVARPILGGSITKTAWKYWQRERTKSFAKQNRGSSRSPYH